MTTINKINDNEVEEVREEKEVYSKELLLKLKEGAEQHLAKINSMLDLLK